MKIRGKHVGWLIHNSLCLIVTLAMWGASEWLNLSFWQFLVLNTVLCIAAKVALYERLMDAYMLHVALRVPAGSRQKRDR